MNQIFSGSLRKDDQIYDYSGIWSRKPGAVEWKSVVRNEDVVCRPSGQLDDALTDEEIVEAIRQLVEISVLDALEASRTG